MSCDDILNALLPNTLPMVLGLPEAQTLSDTSEKLFSGDDLDKTF